MIQNACNVITVHSYKGGSGKSTISINFAKILSELGNRVLLIENDPFMPTYLQIFKQYWQDDPPGSFWNEYLSYGKKKPIQNAIVKTKFNFDVICTDPSFNAKDQYLFADKKKFRDWLITLQKIKIDLKKSQKYDTVIFDCSPGWNFIIINNLIISDLVVLVSRLNKYEVIGTKKMIEDIYLKTRSWVNNLYLVWNQIPKVSDSEIECLIKRLEGELNRGKTKVISKFARIPLDDQYAFKTALGDIVFNDGEFPVLKKLLTHIIKDFSIV
ncbi:MAG: ParA family protein [Candidatus Hodarchaeales archaeon]